MLKKWFGNKDESEKQPDEQSSSDSTETEEPSTETDHESPRDSGQSQAPTKGRWSFLTARFKKTREGLKDLFGLKGKLDETSIEDIEAALYGADFGPKVVSELIDGEQGLRAAWKSGDIEDREQVLDYLKGHLKSTLLKRPNHLAYVETAPTVYLVAGVNGTGKTTSIAKIANRLLGEGHKVLLVAADTFRAAAVEQLTIWSQRLGIEIVTGSDGADPASVAYAGVQKGIDDGIDYVIVDTAGRLHTDKNLMRELKKIRDVVEKKRPGAPHESLLVLDSTNGQNAIQQAESFKRDIDITGIVLTKLDGTAKGGVVFAIHEQLEIPVKLVGVGEKIGDLATFDPDRFVDALFEEGDPSLLTKARE